MSDPLFQLEGIRLQRGGRPVLEALDLTLAAGERLALTGPNGAGKTTLLQLMVGLLKPAAGTLRAFGRERRTEADFREVRTRAGLLFQDPDDQLFCPTVAEDVAFGPLNLGRSHAESHAIVERTLSALDLAHLADRVTYHLSGGEKRLVSLAAVLAMEPEALLLDEPTNGLDDAARGRLLEVLQGLPQALLVCSHDHAFLAALCTRRCRLARGRLEHLNGQD